MKDYSYQNRAAKEALVGLLGGQYVATVLAACPGSGKTTISHMIINSYLKLFPKANILVLTEGQNLLKNQYIEDLSSPNTPIEFSFGALDSEAQVRVGIPQSIQLLNLSSIDLLVVDEAHNFYLANNVQSIIKKLQPKHQLLLTGTPTKYTLHNDTSLGRKYGMVYISAEDLENNNVFSKVDMDILKLSSKNSPFEAVEKMFEKASKNKDNISKIMIACPNISFAKKVADNLKYRGRKVSLSTSDNDKDSSEVKRFKSGETDVLVVVGRGILGFNDSKITMLADFRSSSNLDAGYQIFARVLRTHPQGLRKAYYRISDNASFNKQVIFMHKIAALMKRDVFKKYNGTNLTVNIGG